MGKVWIVFEHSSLARFSFEYGAMWWPLIKRSARLLLNTKNSRFSHSSAIIRLKCFPFEVRILINWCESDIVTKYWQKRNLHISSASHSLSLSLSLSSAGFTTADFFSTAKRLKKMLEWNLIFIFNFVFCGFGHFNFTSKWRVKRKPKIRTMMTYRTRIPAGIGFKQFPFIFSNIFSLSLCLCVWENTFSLILRHWY